MPSLALNVFPLAFFALGLALTSPSFAQSPWTVEGRMATLRHQSIAGDVNGKIYVVTGTAPGAQATALNQEFDPATGVWREREPMPSIASHAGGTSLGGKVYVVGGFTANPHAGAMDMVWEYDTASDTWREATRLSSPRGSVGVVALDGKLHVIGGRGLDSITVGTHEVYDPVADSWSMAAPLPVARDHLGIAVANGRIHVFGGRIDGTDTNSTLHDIYDSASDSWSSAAPMPTARSGGTGFHLDGLVVYFGGECRRDLMSAFDETDAYDIASGEWASLPSPGHGAHGAPAAVIGDTAYVLGGRIGCGGSDELSENVYGFRRD